MTTNVIVSQRIESRIQMVRGFKVIIDADLAELYGVETRTLNQAVKRNQERFPIDFLFQLNADELEHWRSQIVMSNPGTKMGLRRAPYAFTEHGALMAATVLNSPRAVEMSLYVVRAFTQLREVLVTHKDFADKLATLERQMQALSLKHDSLAQNTRLQLKQVFDAIRELMTPPVAQPKRPIGFVTHEEKPAKSKAKARRK
jgi:ORF6N domain